MLKILFLINNLVAIIGLVFWVIGIKIFGNYENNIKGIKYILLGTNITGICIILNVIFL